MVITAIRSLRNHSPGVLKVPLRVQKLQNAFEVGVVLCSDTPFTDTEEVMEGVTCSHKAKVRSSGGNGPSPSSLAPGVNTVDNVNLLHI